MSYSIFVIDTRHFSFYLSTEHTDLSVSPEGVTTPRLSCCSSCCGPLRVASYATWLSWRNIWRRKFPGTTWSRRNGPCSFALSSLMTHTSTMSSKLRYVHRQSQWDSPFMTTCHKNLKFPTVFYSFAYHLLVECTVLLTTQGKISSIWPVARGLALQA